ncbi:MAG: prepilin-type N-terminal cleavage/methylation protein, partial [Gammaproteobacteria bacterium]|nr:prepilin-type N-terminal cleavage/methylation protein [Gammaproteobacteria bacterium]
DLVQLGHTILYAKNYSISHNVKLSLCPSQDHLNCQDNWSQGAILFVDPKAELAPSRTDIIISLPALPPKAELLLKAFPKTSYLQFSPWGILNTDNGRFIYSLPNGKSQSLIFSKTGRIRFSNS